MENERRKTFDRRESRRLLPQPRMLVLYLMVVIAAVVILQRDSARTDQTLKDQCMSRNEARTQSNERNAVIRKDFVLTQNVWRRIAETQVEPANKREASNIADEYSDLIKQIKDYEPIDCSEIR